MQADASVGAFDTLVSLPYTVSLDHLLSGDESGSSAKQFIDDSPTPEDALASMQQSRDIASFLMGLSARERQIVQLYFWEEKSQSEIANSFGVSKMAISKTISRVCARGRSHLAHFDSQAGLH